MQELNKASKEEIVDEVLNFLIQCNRDIHYALDIEDYKDAANIKTLIQVFCSGQAQLFHEHNGRPVNEIFHQLLERSNKIFQIMQEEKDKFNERHLR